MVRGLSVFNGRMVRGMGHVSSSSVRYVPSHIEVPSYVNNSTIAGLGKLEPYTPLPEDKIPCIRRTCKKARELLDYCGSLVKPGITTEDLDVAAHEFAIEAGCYPSPLLYHGFPKSICTSVNNVICHGIPDSTVLNNGDIINIDITLYKEGVHGDCSATFLVGKGHPQDILDLVETAKLARNNAIAICGPKVQFHKICQSVHQTLTSKGYRSFHELTGHGIGTEFHSKPIIIHWPHPTSTKSHNKEMEKGMIFTIEPAVTPGHNEFYLSSDDWSILTIDNSWCALFEHTILITENGHEILT